MSTQPIFLRDAEGLEDGSERWAYAQSCTSACISEQIGQNRALSSLCRLRSGLSFFEAASAAEKKRVIVNAQKSADAATPVHLPNADK